MTTFIQQAIDKVSDELSRKTQYIEDLSDAMIFLDELLELLKQAKEEKQ